MIKKKHNKGEPISKMPHEKKRNAKDLALLIQNYPFLVNELDRLDEFSPEDADPWERDPSELLPEAKRLLTFAVAENGNFVPQ